MALMTKIVCVKEGCVWESDDPSSNPGVGKLGSNIDEQGNDTCDWLNIFLQPHFFIDWFILGGIICKFSVFSSTKVGES